MEDQGIVITGTSGVGKSAIALRFCEKYKGFQRVQAVTTRERRSNDEPSIYKYISKEEFEKLNNKNQLLIKSQYRREKYGITIKAFQEVLSDGKVPVLILTPESSKQLDESRTRFGNFLIVFLDAPDSILDSRLSQRGEKIDSNILTQRHEDRERKDEMWKKPECHIYLVKNDGKVSTDDVTELIYELWKYGGIGGVLPKKLIELMIKCRMLVENATLENVSYASYDLSLDDTYWQNGKKDVLDENKSFIELKPGDYVLISSKEIANLPKDITGRFDLAVSLFCQGVILSNGPQVDPGFNGKLFCLLFNAANETVNLKRGQHYATLEFVKVLYPTLPYSGKYQGKIDIIDYLPKPAKPSVIVKLVKDVENLKKAKFWERTLPIILAIIALLFSIGLTLWNILK